MAEGDKKKKKKGKKGINYYGKAGDGYDPSQQDPSWEGATGESDSGFGAYRGSTVVSGGLGGKSSGYRKQTKSSPAPKPKKKEGR